MGKRRNIKVHKTTTAFREALFIFNICYPTEGSYIAHESKVQDLFVFWSDSIRIIKKLVFFLFLIRQH